MPFQSYPGNLAMHDVVNAHRYEYITSRKSGKSQVLKKIIQELKTSGARFLKPYREFQSKDSSSWIEADDHCIYEKISHAMRQRQRTSRMAAASKAGNNTVPTSSNGVPTVPSVSVGSPDTSLRGIDYAHYLLTANDTASVPPEQLSNVNSLLAQLFYNSTRAASATRFSNQFATLQASLQPKSSSSLSRLGLTCLSSSFLSQTLLGHQFLHQSLRHQQTQQQPLLDLALSAQLCEQQLQREIENQRFPAVEAALPPPLQQQANAAFLQKLLADKRVVPLLKLLGQQPSI
jgi:hypothetical protein